MESKSLGTSALPSAKRLAGSKSRDDYDDDIKEIRLSMSLSDDKLAAKDIIGHTGFISSSIHRGAEEKRLSSNSPAWEELDEDEAAEAEFQALLKKPNVGQAMISTDPIARRIAMGIKINYMNMRDGETGLRVWESYNFGTVSFTEEMHERIPRSILKCRAVSREINFSSREMMTKFRIEQRVFFRGQCIEEWFFSFGFVIPGSTNSWEQIIEAAAPSEMFSAEELSGHVTFETTFLDDKLVLCKNLVRIFYV